MTEMRADLKLAMSDITEEINNLAAASNGMSAAATAGEFFLSLDRAERSARALSEKYIALRKAILNEPIQRPGA